MKRRYMGLMALPLVGALVRALVPERAGPAAEAAKPPTRTPVPTATATPVPAPTNTPTPGPSPTPGATGTWYVAPTGNDANPGTITQPFFTVNKAASAAVAGDTIYLRGGTYAYNATQTLSKSGTAQGVYKIWAYPGERPVLDFSTQARSTSSRGFNITGAYWHLKGLEITRAGDNGIKCDGGNNTFENLVLHHNDDTGLQIGNSTTPSAAANNLVLNCDSYRNFDPAGAGGNADGFACKLGTGAGNVFRGCRAWENSDDGWDFYDSSAPATIESCWTWHNGDRALFGGQAGNGNGFKVGGNYNHAAHTLKNCVSFNHVYGDGASNTKGFDQNHAMSGQTMFNCTAWNNRINYSFAETPNDGSHHVLKNNVGFAATVSNVSLSTDTIQQNNSWNLAVTADAADFQSLSEADAAAARQADNSLPNNAFARLVAGSDLIDKGVNVGLPYCGAAPDLGAFEVC